MGRRGKGSSSATDAPDRDAETVRVVEAMLLERPVNVTLLRKVAAIRGLANDGLRARVWPLLLGVEGGGGPAEAAEFAARAATPHKDSHVVTADMARSLWAFTEGWSDGEREARRAALRRVLDAAIGGNAGGIHYYQGLHDVAAVLLFVCRAQLPAYRLLRALVGGHLRDCTRADLGAATETLRLLYPILEQCDPELHAYLMALREPALEVPYFALSWYLTWFSHDVPALPQAARLFDLFLASHPLMPLYLAAVAIRGNREQVLACGDDGLAAYATLKTMRFLQPGQPSADELAQQAAALYRAVPPARLARQRGIVLEHSAAIDAFLRDGRWRVPAEPRARRRRLPGAPLTVQQVQAALSSPAALLSTVTAMAAVGAVLLAQLQAAQWGRG